MIFQFFNDLFINVDLSFISILKFGFVDLLSFSFSLFVIYLLYCLFFRPILKSLKRGGIND